jgi:hypothetical protein
MATPKQIEANKRNALRSTGPATAAGRGSSSRNAWKHGLTAREVTVDEAEAEKFAVFRDDIVADLAPEGAFEEELAEEIATHSWRLRRVHRMEVKRSSLLMPTLHASSPAKFNAVSCATLVRYETSIARLRERALHDLERLQARRRGEAVDTAIVVDVAHSKEVGSEVEGTMHGGRLETAMSVDRDSTAERSHAVSINQSDRPGETELGQKNQGPMRH